jgi:hypothetical protein
MTAVMRRTLAGRLRSMADEAASDHPTMQIHGHMRDAARQLDSGNLAGAQRHLRAAIQSLTPTQLYRHGQLTDDDQAVAKAHMADLTRHLLGIKDIEDSQERSDRQQAAKVMNAPATTPIGRPDGTAAGPDAPISTVGKRLPARSWIKEGQESAGPKLMAGEEPSQVLDLVGPKGYVHGWVKVDAATGPFGKGTKPGSFEHLRAIADLADRAGNRIGDPAHNSPTMQTALHNLARSVAARDMAAAKAHLESAQWGNMHEAGGSWTRELASLGEQLGKVPQGVSSFNARAYNPLSPRSQHLGKYVSGHGVPANPTAGALNIPAIEFSAETGALSVTDWVEVYGIAIELSAQTARLAVTPAPYGQPGGPGLYGVAGNKHSDYFEQVVKALMRKRGMDKATASKIAWGALRKWRAGGGHVHPEVRTAAAGALAEEDMARARAMSNDDAVAAVIELFNPNHGPTGQFTTAQNAQSPQGKQQGKLPPRFAHMNTAQRKAAKGQLLMKARADMQQAANIRAQIHALAAQLRGSRASTKSGATAAASSKTAGAARSTAAKSTAAKSASSTPRKTSGPPRASALTSRIQNLRNQMHSLIAAAHAARQLASKL